MANLLFVCKTLHEEEGANIQCFRVLAEGLSRCGHKVFFVADELYGTSLPKDHLFKLLLRCKKIHFFVDKKIVKYGSNSALSKFWYLAATLLNYCETWLRMHRMTSACRRIIKTEKIDYVVSVFQEIYNHFAAYKLTGRRREPKWIMYNLDQITFNPVINDEQKEYYKNIEQKFAKRVHKIINSENMEDEYVRNGFTPYCNIPRIEVPLPNLKPHTADVPHKDNEKTTLRYFGCFYEDIRNPDLLIKMINNLEPEKYSVEFYGACCEYLSQHYKQLPACVSLKGTVSHEECDRLISDSDVLINLGNKCENQMPSKVFEYIGSGKPILNFYFTEHECSMKYLQRYPCILNVRYDQNISGWELDEFCRSARQIPEEEIREIYSDALSGSVIQKISDFIER